MKRGFIILLGMSWAIASYAQAVTEQKRFIPLDRARDGIPIRAKTAQNSDRATLESGGFRSDRPRFIPLNRATQAAPVALIATPTSPTVGAPVAPLEPTIIRGVPATATDNEEPLGNSLNADPVLSLFDSNQAAPLGSFRDVLLGKIGGGTAVPTRSSNTHRWPLPLSATQTLSSGYGPRADPLDGSREFHGGIDISAAVGTPVLASADGGVLKVGNDARYGKFIAILHADGSESHYGHLSGQNVREGDLVKAGQTIGAVGATGRVTGAHLDYRIKRDGQRIDPMSVLSMPANLTYAKGESRSKPKDGVNILSGIAQPARTAKSYRLITVK